MREYYSELPERPDLPRKFGVQCNSNGPWSNLTDHSVKDAIIRMAGEAYSTQLWDQNFPDFLDTFTLAWKEFCIEVENTSRKYGFRQCKDLSEVLPDERSKVALLSLTINGSFVLLGNGCLTHSGSMATYKRILLREKHTPQDRHVTEGIACAQEPKVGTPFYFSGNGFPPHTSPIYLLYYTTDSLPEENALHVAEELEESIHHLCTEIFSPVEKETDIEPHPEIEVPDIPELVPLKI